LIVYSVWQAKQLKKQKILPRKQKNTFGMKNKNSTIDIISVIDTTLIVLFWLVVARFAVF